MDVRAGLYRQLSAKELLNCGVGEDSWESLGLQGDPTSPSYRKSVLNVHWKDWCWSWNSNTLATWCKELTHLKRPWYSERSRVEGKGDDRGWDCWMASPTQWTWVWVNFRNWWWTGRPMLRSMRSQESDMTEQLNWLGILIRAEDPKLNVNLTWGRHSKQDNKWKKKKDNKWKIIKRLWRKE